jgi:hypothetical protein
MVDEHPVQLRVTPSRIARGQIVLRLALFAILGCVSWSSLYWALYLALPVAAAVWVTLDGPERYAADDSRDIVRVLQWIAGAYAYGWLLTDAPPGAASPVELRVESGGQPTATSALLRLVTSLPALVVLGVLSIVAPVLWIVGAVAALATERVPAWVADFFVLLLRYKLRLAAYHLSLVDAYPALNDRRLPDATPPAASRKDATV